MFSASLEIEEKFIYTNMPKLKHLPKTKKQAKYLGPYTVSKVTDSHVTISKDEIGAKKDKKIARHIARPYFERCTELQTKEKSVLDVVNNYQLVNIGCIINVFNNTCKVFTPTTTSSTLFSLVWSSVHLSK